MEGQKTMVLPVPSGGIPVAVEVGVPTAHEVFLGRIMNKVEVLYCVNIPSGPQFAVAAAFQHWDDVDEADAGRMLVSYRN